MKRSYLFFALALLAPACSDFIEPPPPPPPPIPSTVTSVKVLPETLTVDIRESAQFTATVIGTGALDRNVIWSVAGGCTVNTTGTIQATETPATCALTATSVQDPTKSGSATVSIVKFEKIAFWRRIYESPTSWREYIFTMNADGSRERQLTFPILGDFQPSWSPDGLRIAFGRAHACDNGPLSIYVVGVDGNGLTNVSQCRFSGLDPAWSPDGQKLAFQYQDLESPKEMGIGTMNIDGSGFTKLTAIICGSGCSPDGAPSWSPDGEYIYFASSRAGNWEIYRMKGDGTEQTRVTINNWADGSPQPSPDGSKIAFASSRDGKFQIYVMEADGSNETRITSDPTCAQDPAWLLSGKLVYAGGCASTEMMDIWVVDADGKNPRNVTNSRATPERYPAPRP